MGFCLCHPAGARRVVLERTTLTHQQRCWWVRAPGSRRQQSCAPGGEQKGRERGEQIAGYIHRGKVPYTKIDYALNIQLSDTHK